MGTAVSDGVGAALATDAGVTKSTPVTEKIMRVTGAVLWLALISAMAAVFLTASRYGSDPLSGAIFGTGLIFLVLGIIFALLARRQRLFWSGLFFPIAIPLASLLPLETSFHFIWLVPVGYGVLVAVGSRRFPAPR